jgi:hypothetical protein
MDNEGSNHAMTDQSPQLKQTVVNDNTDMARSKEILLSIAGCQQTSDRIQQKTIRIQTRNQTIQIQQANAQQIVANAQAIAELRAAI